MTKILITGGNGFTGRHLAKILARETDWEVVSLQRSPGVPIGARPVYHDLLAPLHDRVLKEIGEVDYVVHAAGLVSAALSVESPVDFIRANVLGTFHLLDALRTLGAGKLIYLSTVEVLGPVKRPLAPAENAQLRPSSPYAASKAAAEDLVNSYRLSFGLPSLVVRPGALFGEGQRLRQFIPGVVRQALVGETVTCYVGPDGIPGSRQWLHIDEFCDVLESLLEAGTVGKTYHVVGPELDNRYLIGKIAASLGKRIHTHDRIVSDTRYAVMDTNLGWRLGKGIDDQLAKTAAFYA
jgi:dTDP-glucose 4,6-dehydratase